VETRAAVEEVQIKNMELQMQKKLFEQVSYWMMSDCMFHYGPVYQSRCMCD